MCVNICDMDDVKRYPFDRGRAKIKVLLSRKSFNGGRNSAKALAALAAAARSLVRETTLKRVTFDVIHVTEVDARDLNSTRLPSVLARFFVPRRGKPGDEATVFTLQMNIFPTSSSFTAMALD